MFGIEIERALDSLANKIAKATIEGFEKGSKILGDIIAAKLDELHERDKEK